MQKEVNRIGVIGIHMDPRFSLVCGLLLLASYKRVCREYSFELKYIYKLTWIVKRAIEL